MVMNRDFEWVANWRLDSLSSRTLECDCFSIMVKHAKESSNKKPKKTFRNPIIFALELQGEMRREGFSQSELARKHGISRVRVNQWLSLLDLPKLEIEKVLAMGDYWERRLVTERLLRRVTSNHTKDKELF